MEDKKETEISQGKADISTNLVVLKIFEKDNFLLFIYKKVERIVSASYLLSNFLSDKEPIKWQFRESGVIILSRVLSLTENSPAKSSVMSEIDSGLLKILSLLNISFAAGFVSEMNFNILKKELENLIETLHFKSVNKNEHGKKPELGKEFFALPHDSFFPQDKKDFGHGVYGAEDGTSRAVAETWSDVLRLSGIHKRQYKGQKYLKDKKSTKESPIEALPESRVAKRQNTASGYFGDSRRIAIIKLLDGKNNLTIKDFSSVIKGCSEKTIQRELLNLVKTGILKKSGERRWSRYSLASNYLTSTADPRI